MTLLIIICILALLYLFSSAVLAIQKSKTDIPWWTSIMMVISGMAVFICVIGFFLFALELKALKNGYPKFEQVHEPLYRKIP